MDGLSVFFSVVVISNVLILVPLVPGGPIENRDFSNLGGVVFWGFNVFLVSLGFFTFVAAYAALVGTWWDGIGGLVVGGGYLLVYLLDLGKIFPTSPTPMGKTLMTLEIVGAAAAAYTITVSLAFFSA